MAASLARWCLFLCFVFQGNRRRCRNSQAPQREFKFDGERHARRCGKQMIDYLSKAMRGKNKDIHTPVGWPTVLRYSSARDFNLSPVLDRYHR